LVLFFKKEPLASSRMLRQESKRFFVEKKNQKTFVHLRAACVAVSSPGAGG
jgi:hypothetical protein